WLPPWPTSEPTRRLDDGQPTIAGLRRRRRGLPRDSGARGARWATLGAEAFGFHERCRKAGTSGGRCMTRSAATAILPSRTEPAVSGSNVVAFPRRAPRRNVSRIIRADGGPGGPSERIDAIIRRIWALRCEDEMSETAAGTLHDELNSLRGSLTRPREGALR